MSQSSNHLRLVSWTWQWVHFTQMASTVTRSQSSRAALGCGGTGDLHLGCAADKSAATAWCYHVNMDQNLWAMFTTPCWIYAMNKGSSEGKRGVQPGTRKVCLIKWPVSVCIYIYIYIYIYQNDKKTNLYILYLQLDCDVWRDWIWLAYWF